MVFQENSLVPSMTVAQNLFLGQEKFYNRLRGIYIAAQQFLQSLNFDVTPTATVAQLGAAKKQMVEIARAVLHDAKVIIFDEPTASLTPEEKKYFFDLVRELKQRGVSVIFISHALEEALLISDRITVLRDGRHVVTDETANFDRARVIQAMVGRDLSKTLYAERKADVRPPGERVLTIENLRMAPMVKNNSLSVFAGQVTGVFGLVGSGRTETFKIAAGILKRDFFHGGEIFLRGRPVRYLTPAPAVRDGIAYITEDRKVEGFFETMSIARNIYMGLLAKLGRRRPFVLAQRGRGGRQEMGRGAQRPRHRPGREGRRTVGRQPAEGRHRQVAGSGAQADRLRRADARRRRGRDRRNPSADRPAGRAGQCGRHDLLLPARDHGAVGPHPGLPAGQDRRGILGPRGHRRKDHVRRDPLTLAAGERRH